MGIFATIGGSIVFHDFNDVKCAFEKLKSLGEVTDDGIWVLDKEEGSGLKAFSESMLTIDIPLFCYKNLYSSIFAYNPKMHRHICEIDQQLYKLTKKKINFSFNPHLLPTFRGILTAIYFHGVKGKSPAIIRKTLIFESFVSRT